MGTKQEDAVNMENKINSVDALQERMKELRKAQKIYAFYT